MSRSLGFVSVVPWLLTSACVTSAQSADTPSPKTAAPAATAPASSVAGDLSPDVVARARAGLAKQIGAEKAESARIVTAEAVTWPNGALGCPQPGRMYTQALVPGYRVVFEADGATYAYHASQKGEFKLCKRPAPLSPGGPQTR
jgi:hypothetical protein